MVQAEEALSVVEVAMALVSLGLLDSDPMARSEESVSIVEFVVINRGNVRNLPMEGIRGRLKEPLLLVLARLALYRVIVVRRMWLRWLRSLEWLCLSRWRMWWL